MNRIYNERIHNLRQIMKNAKVDAYIVPTSDFHGSEYVSDYFKAREYLCGFSGSNGTLLVLKDTAFLWTDGRYFIQAEKELRGTDVVLMKMAEEFVPTIEEYLEENLCEGQTVGFDGRVIDYKYGECLRTRLSKKNISIKYDKDLVSYIWSQRPQLPAGSIRILPEKISGESMEVKLQKVRVLMREEQCNVFICSKLDDIMWLFNIRGCDVECNPVALSYVIITTKEVLLFLRQPSLSKELKFYLESHQILLKNYDEFYSYLAKCHEEKDKNKFKTLLSDTEINFLIGETLKDCNIVKKENPTSRLKMCKSEKELDNARTIFLEDSVMVTKFIYWLKQQIKREEEVTELSAAKYLDQLRKKKESFLDFSFKTISAFGENAALMHYEATEKTNKKLENGGMLLVDSGGQYLGGTTDVTRTIAVGDLGEEEKTHYTAVAKGMLRLSNATFLYGCTGRNLDILARLPLWEKGIDYKCGTGHGIGYILNVHEGPVRIAWKYIENVKETIMEEHMVVSNEPGVYLENKYGIRIENIMVCTKKEKTTDGQFMNFETLTFVPIDLDAIVPEQMSQEDRNLLNDYHKKVFEKVAPYLSKNEVKWLKYATRSI